ncbi:MAG: hypothetical protein J6B29_01440 [Clostridia bacterium]|nr:hypothetical protein [Clostridia bacterium]
MLNKNFVKAISVMLILILSISMAGCSKISEDEAKSIVNDLVEKSYDLNDIYFGKGLNYVDSGNPNAIYMVVDVKERYITKKALAEATYAVFSQDYAQDMIDTAFYGVQSEINQGSVQARYRVYDEDDLIHVNKNYTTRIDKISAYKPELTKITKISSRFIDATLITEQGEERSVSMIKEDGQWRLDDSTY